MDQEADMLNFNRSDRSADAKPADRNGLRPLAPQPTTTPATASIGRPLAAPAPAAPTPIVTPTPAPVTAAADAPRAQEGGAKLIVGRNVKLKGVEISDCEMIVVEGQVEASVSSKGMQIARPGTLKGTAVIDVAEIDGEFSGELTARSRLVVNGTGRVSGTIRYGSLVVAEGGEVVGDVRRLDENAQAPVQPAGEAATLR
jgi:cytoskeletal protein CcmA (bactofilin family)